MLTFGAIVAAQGIISRAELIQVNAAHGYKEGTVSAALWALIYGGYVVRVGKGLYRWTGKQLFERVTGKQPPETGQQPSDDVTGKQPPDTVTGQQSSDSNEVNT
jgi:hypothetical protein